MTLIDHLERHLGPIAEGWRGNAPPSTIQIVRFADRPEPGVSTYMTLGLSKILLPASDSGPVTEELLVSAYDHVPRNELASFLMTFAEFVVEKNRALLRGDVVGPASPIVPGVAASAVYAAIPALFGDGFARFADATGPIEIIWLIPMPAGEARWVKQHGWKAYESALMQTEVDFFDLDRPAVRETP